MSRGNNARRTFGDLERKNSDENSSDFETKRLPRPFSVQSTDDKGTFEGFGAVFDVEHETSSWSLGPEWKDRIRPGAFARTLAEHQKRGTKPLMLLMHERGNIPGRWDEISEGKDGLKTRGWVHPAALLSSRVPVREALKESMIDGLSIGFRVRKATLDQEKKVRDIVDVELAEISIVDIPGGPLARVTDVKAGDPKNIRYIEAVLRDAGLSRSEAKAGARAVRASLDEGAADQRDADANDEPTQREADRSDESNTDAVTDPESLAKSIREFAKSLRSTLQE